MKPYPPLGLLYLSSHLRSRGFETEIYDSTFGSRQDLFRLLDRGPAGVLGIYGNLMTRANVLAIAQHARSAGWLVMLGGPEPSNYRDRILDRRSGSNRRWRGRDRRRTLDGLRVRHCRVALNSRIDISGRRRRSAQNRAGGASHESRRPAMAGPRAHRYGADIFNTWRTHHGMGSISVITARGCPYRCNWCSHSVYGHTHRRRSPKAVVDEIEWAIERYSPEMLWIADDVFTIHHGWLAEYAAEMKRRGIRIPFECITRADRMNEKVAALLAELSCMRVWIGSESGSNESSTLWSAASQWSRFRRQSRWPNTTASRPACS